MALLEGEELRRRLAVLDGWKQEGNAIGRTYQFESFAASVAFVNRVAVAAEAMNHHPDIDIRFDRVTLKLSTHSEGGITGKDLDLAQQLG